MSSPRNQFTRRRLLVVTGATGAAGLLRAGMVWATEGPSSYTPTWASVDQHPPAGDPSAWPYHNFITGARDKAGNWVQFAPKLRSAGGNFDPDEWAQLFVDTGAKFAGPGAEGSGWYRIVNRTNGMVADSWGNSANGAICQQSAWHGGNNQQWRLNGVGNGRYQIINRGTNTALDSLGDSTPGSSTAMWAPNNSPNNHWTITAV